MIILENYPICSIDGVEFYLQTTSLNGGRKIISHEYPNTKNRYCEDLGGLERKFTLNVITDDNDNFENKKALLGVLESEGLKTLIHLEYGELKVICTTYSVENNYLNEAGITRFTINVEVATNNILPIVVVGNSGYISSLRSKLLGKNEEKFIKAFTTVKRSKAKYDSAVKTLKAVSNKMNTISRKIQGSSSTFGNFVTSINQITNSAKTLVLSPSVLGANLKFALENLSVAYNTSKDTFNIVKSMFGIDERDQQAKGNSQIQKDIRNNQDQINYYVNVGIMAIAYDSAVNIQFTNLEELNSVNTALEEGFKMLSENIDKELYQILIDMRIETQKIFSNLAITLPNIADYTIINPISLSVLCYSLYGSLDLLDTIRDLNNIVDTSFVFGKIKILTNV